MAEAAGSREQPAAGRAPPDAAHRAEEEPEPPSLDAPAAAAGRRRERRSGVSAVGAAERFPGGSLVPAAAPDTDACLLEAARATPRRSSIIKADVNGLTTELEQERVFAMRSPKSAECNRWETKSEKRQESMELDPFSKKPKDGPCTG